MESFNDVVKITIGLFSSAVSLPFISGMLATIYSCISLPVSGVSLAASTGSPAKLRADNRVKNKL